MRTIISTLITSATLAFIPQATLAAENPENIVFLGDSITQGGSYLAGPVASYRYQLFKIFTDNNVPFLPMGTTRSASKNVDVSKLTPPYRGNVFPNICEAAASGRTYQYSGHGNGKNFKPDPKTAFPPENRGPVMIKLGQKNPFTGTFNTFYDGSVLKTYSGDTYKKLYGNKKPDTLCVLIGINDLFDGRSNQEIASNVREIVAAYQKTNPKIRVHIFEVLPTGKDNPTGTNGNASYAPYNSYLRKQVGKWSTSSSKVTLDDISKGFYAEDGSMIDTSRGAHPNAQGELVIAGNIARVLGIGQRTCGFPPKEFNDYTYSVKLEKYPTARIVNSQNNSLIFSAIGEKTSTGSQNINFSDNSIVFKLDEEKGSVKARGIFTDQENYEEINFGFTFTAEMLPVGEKNRLAFKVGNKETASLILSESAVFWNSEDQIIYGTKSSTGTLAKFLTTKPHKFRIEHRKQEGFYVWMEDQLIGENLQWQKGNNDNKDTEKCPFIFMSWGTSSVKISNIAFSLE